MQFLNGGDISGAQPRDRQQLIQEFFFHLSGAIDFLAQEVYLKRSLKIADQVNPRSVARALSSTDPIRQELLALHPDTRGLLLLDPYSEPGSHFRIILFRNFVTHIRHSPFFFRMGSFPPASLRLDPRYPADNLGGNVSTRDVVEELELFHRLVLGKCRSVFSSLLSM